MFAVRKTIAIVATLLVALVVVFVIATRFDRRLPENGPIVVTASGLEGRSPQYDSLFVTDPGRSDLLRITDRVHVGQPDWSPDGEEIVFVGPGPGRMGDLYVIDAGGSDERRLTRTRFEESQPAWSPDGTRIAFTREGDLWTMETDGSDQTLLLRIADGDGYVASPSWSPDGSKIAFVRPFDRGISDTCPKNTGTGVFVMDSDGGDPHRITIEGCRHGIEWAPSGEMIAIIGARGRVTLVDTAGATITSFRPPTLPPDRIGLGIAGPVWSPDGRLLAFSLQGNVWTLAIEPGRWHQVTRDTGLAIEDMDWASSSGATVGL